MSFWKKLFKSSSSFAAEAAPDPKHSTEHKGFTVQAAPYKEQGQWQLAGVISKTINGERKEYKFVRADRFADKDEACDVALNKGRQIIDEQGERIFG